MYRVNAGTEIILKDKLVNLSVSFRPHMDAVIIINTEKETFRVDDVHFDITAVDTSTDWITIEATSDKFESFFYSVPNMENWEEEAHIELQSILERAAQDRNGCRIR